MLESLFNEVAGFQACKFIKKRLQHRYFSVNNAKFLRNLLHRTHLVAASAWKVSMEQAGKFTHNRTHIQIGSIKYLLRSCSILQQLQEIFSLVLWFGIDVRYVEKGRRKCRYNVSI